MSDQLVSFVIRGESILLGFLKGFFAQDTLFGQFPNEFVYKNNKEGLIISISENPDLTEPAPALILQEGGFNENVKTIGTHLNHQTMEKDVRYYQASFIHAYTLHCISNNKGSAKLLQSCAAKAIMVFRRAIYEMGIDHISPIQGSPPQRFSAADKQAASQQYDCALSFQVNMDQQWVVSRRPYEDVDFEEFVRINVVAALDDIEFNDAGTPTSPPEDWFEINFEIGD